MSDRAEILHEEPFWTRLEYSATGWLASAADRNLRRLWIDGFIPEAFANTRRGLDVEGTAWVGEGGSMQQQYHFVVSVPQNLLHGRSRDFEIESLSVDQVQHLLKIVITRSTRVAEPGTAMNGSILEKVGNEET